MSDKGLDSEVASETSGDLRLVVMGAYRAFAPPVSYACDGCPEIKQLIFEICSRPEQHVIQTLASNGADQPFYERMRQRNTG